MLIIYLNGDTRLINEDHIIDHYAYDTPAYRHKKNNTFHDLFSGIRDVDFDDPEQAKKCEYEKTEVRKLSITLTAQEPHHRDETYPAASKVILFVHSLAEQIEEYLNHKEGLLGNTIDEHDNSDTEEEPEE